MKTSPFLALLLSAPLACASLEVHEWGTFTTLSGSDGRTLEWYLPFSEPSALPEFVVRRPMVSKFTRTRMRMETPVLYFYPDEPGPVTVEARLEQGVISEIYPLAEAEPLLVSGSAAVRWSGELRPPGDPATTALIPEVAADGPGRHYAAARAVPDAWNYHRASDLTHCSGAHAQAERFIFYRGYGAAEPPLTIQVRPGQRFRFLNAAEQPFVHGILLEVADGEARWARMPVVPAKGAGRASGHPEAGLDGSFRPLAEVEAELVGWFEGALVAEGLTADEARAMVDTWQGLWFREPGLRAFSLVPQAWVDAILPLKIEPSPEKLVRVFVARHELLAPEREQRLANVLLDDRLAAADARAELGALGLGRFSDGALDRASEIGRQRMHARYRLLRLPEETAARTGPAAPDEWVLDLGALAR